MFVVTVLFEVHAQHADAFRQAIILQASNSLRQEDDCHRFDVASRDDEPEIFFLYEIYSDEAAFQKHLDTRHYKDFSATVEDWVAVKEVNTFHLVVAD